MTAPLTVTVIGSAGTHASADRVCSSYLLTYGDDNLVLDLGAGALHNLSKAISVSAISGIIISHMHPDHFLDLYGLQYALRFHPESPGPIPVYGPAPLESTIAALLPDESMQRMGEQMEFRPLEHGSQAELGPFEIELFSMNHPEPCLGSRVTIGDTVVAFTGDTAPTPATTPLARDADLFICDSSWLESQRPVPPDVHNTGLEAGRAATAAAVRRLLITHVSPYNDPQEVAAEAATTYDGEIIVATDLMEITL